jgi:DNA-binding response OmpR family regulator
MDGDSKDQRIEELEEEIRQLRELLAPPELEIPPEWRLTPQQQLLMRCLMRSGYATTEQLQYAGVVSHNKDVSITDNHVKVQINKMRHKLAPHGITIMLMHGIGYQIIGGGKVDANNLCAADRADEPDRG